MTYQQPLFGPPPPAPPPPPRRPATGWGAALQGMERSASRWSDVQRRYVADAIRRTAQAHDEFTTDEVWATLNGQVPVTKGLAGLMVAAKNAGIIEQTGERRTTRRGGIHDHRQSLVVWRSLIRGATS